jgi:hypothetical protein
VTDSWNEVKYFTGSSRYRETCSQEVLPPSELVHQFIEIFAGDRHLVAMRTRGCAQYGTTSQQPTVTGENVPGHERVPHQCGSLADSLTKCQVRMNKAAVRLGGKPRRLSLVREPSACCRRLSCRNRPSLSGRHTSPLAWPHSPYTCASPFPGVGGQRVGRWTGRWRQVPNCRQQSTILAAHRPRLK